MPEMLLNDGAGQFTALDWIGDRLHEFWRAGNMLGATIVDYDLDGDMDICGVAGYEYLVILRNDGSVFQWDDQVDVLREHFHSNYENSEAKAIEAADIDEDGDIDLVMAVERSSNMLLLNDGTGRFTEVQLGDHDAAALAVGDLNNDGHLDIFFGHGFTGEETTSGARDLILVGDGAGHFTSVTTEDIVMRRTETDAWTLDVKIFDADMDGDMDVLTVGWYGDSGCALWLGDGDGSFGLVTHGPMVCGHRFSPDVAVLPKATSFATELTIV
eukprot:SAG31_NODE_2111_length_6426_cov_4.423295_6_plen_271_part_00